MILWVKLGSLPGAYLKAMGIRKEPKVGDRFGVREPKEPYQQPIPVLCYGIKYIDGHRLYLLERF